MPDANGRSLRTGSPGCGPLRGFFLQHGSPERFDRDACVHRAGERTIYAYLLQEGWIARVRTDDAANSAFNALHIAGDLVGVDGLPEIACDDLVALTKIAVIKLPFSTLRAGAAGDAKIGLSLADFLATETMFLREALFAVGRQPSAGRLCTFLLQTYHRLIAAGLIDGAARQFELPLTQVELGTALGLTSVHVNRTLKRLREQGWLEFYSGVVRIGNLEGIKRLAHSAQGHADDGSSCFSSA